MRNATTCRQRQSGFTLVEIAIVLVIIGLLLVGVLKGQELIGSAKVKNLANDFRQTPLFIYGYQDKFKALPGDDTNASNNLSGAAAGAAVLTTGNSNGRIEGLYNSQNLADETVMFWQHVRLAGLASGATTFSSASVGSDLPRNSVGGRIGVQSAVPIAGMSGSLFVCSDGIPGKQVKQLDTQLDNGDTATGVMRAAVTPFAGTDAAPATAVATASIDEGATYAVCMGM